MSERIAYAPEQADFVTPPGDTLLEMLEERGMTQTELAQRTGRPQKTINGIIKGHKAITAETALQLEKVFGVPARFWLAREQDYREFLARQAENDTLETRQSWVNQFPIKHMHQLRWLPHHTDPHQQLIALLQFFGIAHPDNWTDVWQDCLVSYRKTTAYDSDQYALSTWLRQGELEAQDIVCQPYDATAFKRLLSDKIRGLTREAPDIFEPRLVALCASAGVAAVFVPQVDGARVSGATRWLTKDKALIQLSLRYKTNDHFWFSFFHEAGHIIQHGKRDVFIDVDDGIENKQEQEADQFAADILIPPAAYSAFLAAHQRISETAVRQFAANIGIAPGIVVGRLQHDGHLPFTHLNKLKTRFEWVKQ